jgi:hypothetical protein
MSSYISRNKVIQKFLNYSSETLVETAGNSVNLMEPMVAEMAHLNSVEQHTTAAIKNGAV